MDFAGWSPSHLILVVFAIIAFIGHVAIMFYRIGQNDKKIEKHSETLFHAFERLEDRMDKRLSGMQAETNQRLSDMQAETNQRLSDMQAETNQRLSDMQAETNQRLSDMQAEIRDVRLELSKLNQNHIDHLTQHES